jgi:hypothetical protein
MNMKSGRMQKAYYFLKLNQGLVIDVTEFAKETGWAEATLRVYMVKQWSNIVRRQVTRQIFSRANNLV